jgi:lysophospholipase L1-like esterase
MACSSDTKSTSTDAGAIEAASSSGGGAGAPPSGGGTSSGTGGQSSAGGSTATGGSSGGSVNGGAGGGVNATGGSGGQTQPVEGVAALGVRWFGRVDVQDPDRPRFSWSGTGFAAAFSGTGLAVELDNQSGYSDQVFKPVIDGQPAPPVTASLGRATFTLATGLANGDHTVELYRQTEGQFDNTALVSVTVEGGELAPPPPAKARLIEVIGDSISCGYGNLGTSATCGFTVATESHYDSYGAVAGRAVDAEVRTIAISGRGMYRNNTGLTDDTIPKVYDRVLTNDATPTWTGRVPDAIVINLGTNDFAHDIPGSEYAETYAAFLETLRGKYPNAYIICAIGPMMSDSFPAGEMHLTRIRNYVSSVVDDRKSGGDDRVELLEFATHVEADWGCDYHPNTGRHQQMGDALAARLRAALGW